MLSASSHVSSCLTNSVHYHKWMGCDVRKDLYFFTDTFLLLLFFFFCFWLITLNTALKKDTKPFFGLYNFRHFAAPSVHSTTLIDGVFFRIGRSLMEKIYPALKNKQTKEKNNQWFYWFWSWTFTDPLNYVIFLYTACNCIQSGLGVTSKERETLKRQILVHK